jgi:hypothetical protein
VGAAGSGEGAAVKYLRGTGWWLPDGDVKHLHRWLTGVGRAREGRLLYQSRKYDLALQRVKRRKCAVDVGAHAGLWSWMMALDFDKVTAFEPVREHIECWRRNMAGQGNASLVGVALGAEAREVRMERTELGMGLKMAVAERVDLLKIDVEGYELEVLRGGVETLLRTRPTIVVEQKASTDMEARYGVVPGDAVEFLRDLGARVYRIARGDYIMGWQQ